MFNFATSAEYRAEVIEDGKETIRGWGRQFVEWIGSILPSMEGLKQWFTETAQQYLPEAVYKRLFNVPEPVQSVDVSVLDLDGDGRLSEKEVMTDKRVDDGLNATRKLMRQKLVMRLQRLVLQEQVMQWMDLCKEVLHSAKPKIANWW